MALYFSIQKKQLVAIIVVAALLLAVIFAGGIVIGANTGWLKLGADSLLARKDSIALPAGGTAGGSTTFGPAPMSRVVDSTVAGTMMAGIDISHFDGVIKWSAVRRAGIVWAYAKATEGTEDIDPQFDFNWTAMAEAGVIRGAYHFFDPAIDATAQAEHFLSIVQLDSGDLPPMLDLETTGGMSNAELVSGVTAWLATVQKATGRRPVIYVDPSFWNEHMAAGFGGYPVWVADWEVKSPHLPNGWSRWTFWQYSDKGSVSGIKGNVDLDWFNGTFADLKTFIGWSGGSAALAAALPPAPAVAPPVAAAPVATPPAAPTAAAPVQTPPSTDMPTADSAQGTGTAPSAK